MIKEKAFAKINLGLDIIGKRRDGYHDIDTIMQSISLHDDITLQKSSGISIKCSDPAIPIDNRNTVYAAALVFFKKSQLNPDSEGVSFTIEKRIPVQAGLGGGSSDAAAALRGLNKLYGTNYGTRDLLELALKVGSDVPFCITGGTQRVTGRGEFLQKLSPFAGVNLVVVMPDETVNTTQAYSLYDESDKEKPDIGNLLIALKKMDMAKIKENFGNAFETLVFPTKPAIKKAKHDILDTGATAALMTGSGAAVFGIYSSPDSAVAAFTVLKNRYQSYLVETTEELL